MKLTPIVAAIALTANAQAVTISIDTFDDALLNVTQTGTTGGNATDPAVSFAETTTAEAIGGVRETRVHVTSGSGDNSANTDVNPGNFTWDLASSTGGHFHLLYGSSVIDGTASALNLDATGTDAFTSRFVFTDLSGSIKISLLMNAGEGADESIWSASFNVAGAIGAGGPGDPAAPLDYNVLFSSFGLDSGTGAFDLSDIDGITYEVDADLVSRDWQIDSLSMTTITVPEPSSTALLGLGGLALMLRRRR